MKTVPLGGRRAGDGLRQGALRHTGGIDEGPATDADDGRDPEADDGRDPDRRPGEAPRRKEPLVTGRRIVILLVLAAAIAVFVWGTRRTEGTGGITAADDPAVLDKVPRPGDRVPPQARVGADLKPTYIGELIVDGTRIPDDQLEGSVPLGSPEYDATFGSRANNKSRVFFVPGPGKAVSKLRTGEIRIVLEFWPVIDGPHPRAKQRIAWTIQVS